MFLLWREFKRYLSAHHHHHHHQVSISLVTSSGRPSAILGCRRARPPALSFNNIFALPSLYKRNRAKSNI